MKDNERPIGFFDSGLGGLSVWQEVNKILPYEDTIYLADSKNAPYGPKGKEAVRAFSIKNTEFLLECDCKMIVVACNTATTAAIAMLREKYPAIPFIGIEPAIKPAALNTKTKKIGVLATEGTLVSELFLKTSKEFAANIETITQKGTGLVELIESGGITSENLRILLKGYIDPMVAANIDHLVLGCTHYPYLRSILTELLPRHVKVIDSGSAVASRVMGLLQLKNLLGLTQKNKEDQVIHRFYTNKSQTIMQNFMDEMGVDGQAVYTEF